MTALEQLNAYLRRLEWRLRFFAASRGAAIVAALALALTVLLVAISNRYAFAQNVVLPLRVILFVALALAVSFLLAWPLLKLNRRRVTRLVERRAPEFQQRLLTLTERQKAGDPWSEVLAEDALRIASLQGPEQISSSRSLFGALGSGILAALILLWLIAAGPGYWGYGASLLWTGSASASKRPLYDITVQPGNKTVRRKSDQLVTAQLFGFSARSVTLHVKYGNALKWDETPMQPKTSGDGYRFLFAGLSDAVEYYVQADRARSRHFTINVKDLPNVKRVRVALKYPAGLGLRNVMLDPGGDIRAVNGTEAEISVLTDRPLEQGALMMDGGKRIDLKRGEGNWLSARLTIEKDGAYHVAALDNGETVRISDDYFIEAKKDEPPIVKLLKPGRDPHVSPIEEVPVTVEAADDFGVQALELHYSVNGGPEKTLPLLKAKGTKEAQGTTTIAFEDLKVVPGDVVSMYATARDAHTKAQSEMIFAQAEPFDFKFSQSQQMGGGGGGMGNQSSDISQRQKQVIAATFNELRDKGKERGALAEDAKLLSDLQGKLSEQAMTLAQRMASRELGSAGSEFAQFSKLMTDASGDMAVAVEQLKPGKWSDALPPEQKALGSLMRAEALFRDIQVAFGQQNGGGGGGGGAQRDLARMFDLELDTSKNQYETGQQASAQQQQQDVQKALDEAYQRLQALARRQEELAAQSPQQQQQFEQRWEEEQLRREAEELRKQMQQLAQNSQQNQSQAGGSSQQQQGQQQRSSSQQSGQQSGSSSSGSQSASSSSSGSAGDQSKRARQEQQQMAETMKRADSALQRAEEEMRKAVSDRDASARQRAASQLREAQGLINGMMSGQAGNSLSDMANRAQEIANAQKELADRMKGMYGEGSSRSRQRYSQPPSQAGGEQMPEMRDPNSTRFGYGFQRRYGLDEMRPTRTPTAEEKSLAGEKEKLAAELQGLQQQMQQQAQAMTGTRPDASAKLSRALSEAESKELALRLQKDADWIKQGYGDRNVGMENSVTAGLQQLSRDLHDVRSAMNKPGSQVPGHENDKTAQALAEVRQLREELNRRSAEADLQRGSPGQQQSGGENQAGQPGGQQSGREGSYSPRGGAAASGLDREGVQSAISQLRGLRAQVDPHDRALSGYIDGALGNLQHLTGAQAGLLDARIGQDALLSLQRLEVELNKRVTQQESGGTRTGAREESPEKYRDAVAGYFKKLSQGK